MGEGKIPLRKLNSMQVNDFVKALSGVFEKSPWIPELAWSRGPFESVDRLHEALKQVVLEADASQKLALIQAHPELAVPLDRLTSESKSEQKSASLDRLANSERADFAGMHRRYRELFGFPFVICVRENNKQSILENFRARLDHSRDQELQCAIDEICKIAYFRLQDLIA
jgi:2-oxo-4-hydroxy-4-carboxy-5-ureidoimidazoline decarboxylase